MSRLKEKLSALTAAGMLTVTVLTPSGAWASDEAIVPVASQQTTSAAVVEPFWLAGGEHVQYPAEGGTWRYGFWNAKVRSYYKVGRVHGSTVKMDDRSMTSIRTASGEESIAELWAVNYPGAYDQYFYHVY
ncbi:MAG: lactococcin 972 family bacteriocin [Ancrocorticia sp.]